MVFQLTRRNEVAMRRENGLAPLDMTGIAFAGHGSYYFFDQPVGRRFKWR
jgi:hypothetical protein